jgi:hypothetical protein
LDLVYCGFTVYVRKMANSGKVANGHCSSGPGAEVAQAHRQELVEQRQLVAAGRAPVRGGEGEDHTYSPPVNLLFVPAIDWATTIKLGDPSTLKKEPGKPFIGSANAFGDQDPKDQRFGHLTAVDADSGEVRWKYDTDTPMVAAVTPTAIEVSGRGETVEPYSQNNIDGT